MTGTTAGARSFRSGLLAATFCVVAVVGCAGNTREDVIARAGSPEFADLHARVLSQAFTNLSVLPDAAFIVVDGTVINIGKQTYGNEPAGGMYEMFYRQGSKNRFESLPALLKERKIRLTEDEIGDLTRRMKSLGIGDISKAAESGVVSYAWDMSGIWGANGVLFLPSKEALDKARKQYDSLEPIRDGFFYWVLGG